MATVSTIQLPDSLKQSYEQFENYPLNLVYQPSFYGATKATRKRLDACSPSLFIPSTDDVHVAFRDIQLSGQIEKQNIYYDTELKAWLGDQSRIDPPGSTTLTGEVVTKRDPKCRFIFIYSEHSRAHLKITKTMLLRILSYHQVMPSYLDFMSVFGSQSKQRDLRFSGFNEQIQVSGHKVLGLGRSGRQFQLCYNLKSVSCKSPINTDLKDMDWSVRQAAFHHQFDLVEGTTIWIVTKGRLDIKDRIEVLTGDKGRPEDRQFETVEDCFRSSLSVHLTYCHWSTEEWRCYLQWLEDLIDKDTQDAILGSRNVSQYRREYTPEDLQDLQRCEDRTSAAIMIIEANVSVLTRLRDFYKRLPGNEYFPSRTDCQADLDKFVGQVDEMIYESGLQISRAKLLARITSDRKDLILQHLQSQATQKMEALTISMHHIGEMSQKEAITVRIITIVTLIYLPATFVSTFFSTDIVKYQNQGTGDTDSNYSSFSETALLRWLQVTLPLTAVTLVCAFIAFRHADFDRKKQNMLLPFYSFLSAKTSKGWLSS